VIGSWYYINGYWLLLYQWLLVDILLLDIGGYLINGYWWLFHCKPFVVINGYCIIGYCWLLYVILQIFLIIVLEIIVRYSML
jgi:hypothetical protein